MDTNNSMVNNSMFDESSSKNKDSKKHDKTNMSNISKSKIKSKSSKYKIECKNDPEQKYEINSEEFAIHIISCENCLKELFLYQARQERKAKELLNDINKNKKKQKKRKKADIINSISESTDYIQDIFNEED